MTKKIDYLKDARAVGLSLVGHRLVLKPWTPPKRTSALPLKVSQSIAACAALDLTYWSDHPQSRLVWASDNHGRFHEVEVVRETGVALHYCGKSRRMGAKGELIDTVPCAEVGRRASWTAPSTMTDLFSLLGSESAPDTEPWPQPQQPPAPKPAATKFTAAERRIIKERNQRREAQREAEYRAKDAKYLAQARLKLTTPTKGPGAAESMAVQLIAADPSLIPNLHTDYLLSAVGHTDYDEQITAELHNRGIPASTEAS